jgi:hypothetical protein
MISRLFLNHPRSVNETYLQHLAFAGKFSAKLVLAACAALIHALIPCCFEKTASTIVAELYQQTHSRNSEVPATEPPLDTTSGVTPTTQSFRTSQHYATPAAFE